MRFGVLGAGRRATSVHATALAAHPDAELAGIWGPQAAEVAAAGAEFDVLATTDLDALLAGVDAVCLAVPPAAQGPLAVRAAEAGRHLLLGEPVGAAVDDADRVARAVRAAGVASVAFFAARFQTATSTWLTQAARAPLSGGSVTWLSRPPGPGDDGADGDGLAGRGALWDLGSQALALLVPALGPVTGVQAVGGVGDTVHLLLGHEGGATSTITVSRTAAPLACGTETWLHGDAGRLVLLPEPGDDAVRAAHRVAVAELAAAAVTGAVHPCDAGFARDVTAVLTAADRALASGCREPVGTGAG